MVAHLNAFLIISDRSLIQICLPENPSCLVRAIILNIDKTSYSLSSDFTMKWNHVSDSCLREAENLYIFVRFPYFYEHIPYFDYPYYHISLKSCSMMPVYLTS